MGLWARSHKNSEHWSAATSSTNAVACYTGTDKSRSVQRICCACFNQKEWDHGIPHICNRQDAIANMFRCSSGTPCFVVLERSNGFALVRRVHLNWVADGWQYLMGLLPFDLWKWPFSVFLSLVASVSDTAALPSILRDASYQLSTRLRADGVQMQSSSYLSLQHCEHYFT